GAEAHADDSPLRADGAPLVDREILRGRVNAVTEVPSNRVERRVFLRVDDVVEGHLRELLLRATRDLVGSRIREEHMSLVIDDEDAIGRRMEEVGVALERLEASLGFEACERDLLRLIAE